MLQAFSDRIRNSRWLGYAIVALIVVPFALWGVQSYFAGGGSQDVATVAGNAISEVELERRVSQRRAQIRSQNDGEIPEEQRGAALERAVLDEMIERRLVTQLAIDWGMTASDQRVAQQIRNQEQFQVDGEFDRERYNQILARNGLQPGDYEADVRQSVRVQQLQNGLMSSGFVLASEAQRIATLEGQTRTISRIRVAEDALREDISIDEEDLRAFYDEHPERFQTERQVRVAYVELDVEGLAEDIEVSSDEVRAEYDNRVQQEQQQERRRAEHILIEVDSEAGEEERSAAQQQLTGLRDQIRDGADFNALAEENSDDVGSASDGGDLGWIERGDMVEPFEEALFGLEEAGEITGPVRTRFGYHLIRLVEREDTDTPSFEELEDEIRTDLRRRRAEENFFDRVDQMANRAFENPGNLEPVAEAAGASVETSDWFSEQEGDGIASASVVRETAFSTELLKDRRNSDVIELEERHVAVVRVVDEREPEPIPFAEAESRIRTELMVQRVEQRRQEVLDQAERRLVDGASIDQLTAQDELPIEVGDRLTVGLNERQESVPRSVLETAFDLPAPAGDGVRVATVDSEQGETSLVVLHDVAYGEPEEQRIAQLEFGLQGLQSGAELEAWLQHLRSESDVEVNEGRLGNTSER